MTTTTRATRETETTCRDLRPIIARERAEAATREEIRYLPVAGYYDTSDDTLELPAFREGN